LRLVLEREAVLLGDEGSGTETIRLINRAGQQSPDSTGQHRTKVNPELYRPGKCGGQYSKRRVERVRRPTRRSVLRRPRVHIRLRDTQTVPEPAPYSYTRRSRRGHDKGFSVHSIAIRVAKSSLTHNGSNPTNASDRGS